MSGRAMLNRPAPFFVLASVACILATQYYFNVEYPLVDSRMQFHRKIIDGTAENPFRYRILAPFAAEGIYRRLVPLFGESQSQRAFLAAYALFNLLAIWAALYTLYLFLREFFSVEQSLIGCLLAAITLGLTFREQIFYFHPWSLLEMPLFNTGLLLMYRSLFGWLLTLIVLSAFNRETSAFLLLVFLFTEVASFRPRLRIN